MSVYFCNEEPIELELISVMGLSIKETENPIGMFGTGLKYALGKLLRTGHKVTLVRSGRVHSFGVREATLRGKSFEMVTLDGDDLGFVTSLGKNWQTWQAYRELHSNTLDEAGVISDHLPPGEWGTVIRVDGAAMEDCYRQRASIFIDTEPVHKGAYCEVHANASPSGFYRGVKVLDMPKPALFGYNVTTEMELTEDRTVNNQSLWDLWCSIAVETMTDEDSLRAALMAHGDNFESTFRYGNSGSPPSELFRRICDENRMNSQLNQSALTFCKKYAASIADYEEISLTTMQAAELTEALSLLTVLDCHLERTDFVIVESLGPQTYGSVRDGRICIDKNTMDKGVRFIASTLYEEWLHKVHNYEDESRALQSMLFEELLYFVAVSRQGGDAGEQPKPKPQDVPF